MLGFAISLSLILALSGCGGAPPLESGPSYTTLMGRAETNALVGDREAAIDAYRHAAKINPVAAKPWIEMAKLYFRGDDYGHAIVAAREALKRKPSSWRVDSILTISGLRVAFDALSRLRKQVGVKGTVREEAERLVRLLRNLLGQHSLVTGDDSAFTQTYSEPLQSSTTSSTLDSGSDYEYESDADTTQTSTVITGSSVDNTVDQVQQSTKGQSDNPFSVLKELGSH